MSTYYLSVNRNKRSFALDLSHEKGREIAKDLAKNWADVVVENFKPGTMKKMGLDYEDLKNENKGLVYCSIRCVCFHFRFSFGLHFNLHFSFGLLLLIIPSSS